MKNEIETDLKIALDRTEIEMRRIKKEFYTILYQKVEILSRLKKIEVFKKIEKNS